MRAMRFRIGGVALLVSAVGLLTGGGPAGAATDNTTTTTLTSAQLSTVLATMNSEGATADEIAYVKAHPSDGLTVAVSSSVETTSGGAATTSATDAYAGALTGMLATTGAVEPASVGSDCSGYGGWVERTQYENNATGQHLAYIKLHTDFCYNFSRVTTPTASAPTTYMPSVVRLAPTSGWVGKRSTRAGTPATTTPMAA